jgi:hypothetical protein
MNKSLLMLLFTFPSFASAHAMNTFHTHDGVIGLFVAIALIILTKQIIKRKNEKNN